MKGTLVSMKKLSVDNRPVGSHILTLTSLSVILVAVTHSHSALCLVNYSHTVPLPSSSNAHLPPSSMCHDLIPFFPFLLSHSPSVFTVPSPHTPHCLNALEPLGSIYIFPSLSGYVLETPQNWWTAS